MKFQDTRSVEIFQRLVCDIQDWSGNIKTSLAVKLKTSCQHKSPTKCNVKGNKCHEETGYRVLQDGCPLQNATTIKTTITTISLSVQRFAGWLREPKLSLHSSSHYIVAICVRTMANNYNYYCINFSSLNQPANLCNWPGSISIRLLHNAITTLLI
jgi:hypothetical protein